MKNGVPAGWLPIIEAWRAPQVGGQNVLRWSKYIRRGQGVRKQNVLQHETSIAILGAIGLARLQLYGELNGEFVMAAFALHDVPEILRKRKKDVLHIDKTDKNDLAEYRLFRRCYEPLGPPIFHNLHRAYLLQFARKNLSIFPRDARKIMGDIAQHSLREALAFDAIERWDYVLYALEQYHERGNAKILVQVLRHQVAPVEILRAQLPGFREEIWTDEFSTWVGKFLKTYEGRWIEQKGEV